MDAGTRMSRRFREGWSLAAGWAAPPWPGWFAAVVAIALPISGIAWVEWSADGNSADLRRPGAAAFPALLVAWLVWSLSARAVRRRVGERRARRRDGAACWRD